MTTSPTPADVSRSAAPDLTEDVVARPRRGVPWFKRLAYYAQGSAALVLYALVKLLPLPVASRLTGGVAHRVGRRLSMSRRAYQQLAIAMPDLPPATADAIVAGAWRNLGYLFAEYSHIKAFLGDTPRLQITGLEHLRTLAGSGRPVLIFSAHLANWEMATIAAQRGGLAPHVFFRPFNNPIIEYFARREQRRTGAPLIAKSASGARRMMQVLAHGGQVIMLVDQRQSGGTEVPFFGQPSATPPAIAKLAYRFGAAILPIRVERVRLGHFQVTVEPPLDLPDSGDPDADMAAVLTTVNRRLETWIRARPDQWVWFHRRWRPGA